MEKSETMRQVGQQSLELDENTKNCIFEIAKNYSEKSGINLSELLIYGTDVYLLAVMLLQMPK